MRRRYRYRRPADREPLSFEYFAECAETAIIAATATSADHPAVRALTMAEAQVYATLALAAATRSDRG